DRALAHVEASRCFLATMAGVTFDVDLVTHQSVQNEEPRMERMLGKFSGVIYAAFRIVFGILFACHGAQKLFGFLGAEPAGNMLMVTAGVIEFFGGLLIAVGFFTGWVAFIASGEMAAAYFMMHAPQGLWPIANDGELAVLYCFSFLYMASRGSGLLCVDRLMGRRS
ncbi:MAG: DoxX family protein, partial [Dehalococcoidia bacterium]